MKKNEVNVRSGWALQLGGLGGGAGALEAPSGGLGAQSQKALKFCILMTFRGFWPFWGQVWHIKEFFKARSKNVIG